jgi:hypothetical protein
VHIVLPAGGIDTSGKQWLSNSRKYLFPYLVLKTLFRENFLAALRDAKIPYPPELHKTEWVVNIRAAGTGEPAFMYLSRYLYRGVIQERNILSDMNGRVTFKYLEAKTDTWQNRTLPAVDFLYLLLTHVLPKRFRRTRSYGFLHGNAANNLRKIQIILKAAPSVAKRAAKPLQFKCPDCGALESIVAYNYRRPFDQLSQIRGSPI